MEKLKYCKFLNTANIYFEHKFLKRTTNVKISNNFVLPIYISIVHALKNNIHNFNNDFFFQHQ